jgi:trigger factor
MQYQAEKTGPTQAKFSVNVSAQQVEEAFALVSRQISRNVRLPGFRPGHVPRQVIERQYESQIKSEVQSRLVDDSLVKAMHESKMSPIAILRIEPGKLRRGDAFEYTAEIEIHPEITLKEYKGLAVKPVTTEVSDAEVDAQLETMRKQATDLVPVLIRDQVQQGDVVLIDYIGSVGGMPIEGAKAENSMVEIGGAGYLPGFTEALIGARVPGERTIPIDFPADYSVEHLRGKSASFQVKLKELKTKELPALDDEFAKDLGEESLAALRAKVVETVKAQKSHDAKAERRHEILKALVAANPVDLPPSVVKSQAERLIADAHAHVERLVGQRVSLSEKDLTTLRTDSQESAEFQVRAGMLLIEVAKQEKLEVTDAEIEAEVAAVVARAGEQAERVRAYFNSPTERSKLRYRLLEDKAIGFLLDHAKDAATAL